MLMRRQGEGKSTKEVLRRIDYGGSITLLISVTFTAHSLLFHTVLMLIVT
jgi:hypothetical protein